MAKINVTVEIPIYLGCLTTEIPDQCTATEIQEFIQSLDIQTGNPDMTKELLKYFLTSYRDGLGRDLNIDDINELMKED